jgi:hypothetical protein
MSSRSAAFRNAAGISQNWLLAESVAAAWFVKRLRLITLSDFGGIPLRQRSPRHGRRGNGSPEGCLPSVRSEEAIARPGRFSFARNGAQNHTSWGRPTREERQRRKRSSACPMRRTLATHSSVCLRRVNRPGRRCLRRWSNGTPAFRIRLAFAYDHETVGGDAKR